MAFNSDSDEPLTDLSDNDFSVKSTPAPDPTPTIVDLSRYPRLEQPSPKPYTSPYPPLPESQQNPYSVFSRTANKSYGTNLYSGEQSTAADIPSSPAVQRTTRAALRRNREEQSQAGSNLPQPSKPISQRTAALQANRYLMEHTSSSSEDEYTVPYQSNATYTQHQDPAPHIADAPQAKAKLVRSTDPEQIALAFRARKPKQARSQLLQVASHSVHVGSVQAQEDVPRPSTTEQPAAAELALSQLLPPVLADTLALIHDHKILTTAAEKFSPSWSVVVDILTEDLMSLCIEVVELIQHPGSYLDAHDAHPLIAYYSLLAKCKLCWGAMTELLPILESKDGVTQYLNSDGVPRLKLMKKANPPGSVLKNDLLRSEVAAKHVRNLEEGAVRSLSTLSGQSAT